MARERITHWFSVPSVATLTMRLGEVGPGTMPTLVEHLVLDEDGHPAEEGELCLRGAQRFLGYLDEADNAHRFLSFDAARPPARVQGECTGPGAQLWYRSGDRVRRTDGLLVHLGRIDQQVKIRGFRIELSEVEAAVRGQAGISEAVVVAVHGTNGEVRLEAAYTGREQPEPALRAALRTVLPDYMVPHGFTAFAELPLNTNGAGPVRGGGAAGRMRTVRDAGPHRPRRPARTNTSAGAVAAAAPQKLLSFRT